MGSPLGLGFKNGADGVDRHVEAAGDVAVGGLETGHPGEAFVKLAREAGPVVGQGLHLHGMARIGLVRLQSPLDRVLEAREGGGEALQSGIEGL
jgi:hypothetical protein